MKRGYLAAGVVIVVVAVVGLFVLLRTDNEPDPQREVSASKPQKIEDADPGKPRNRVVPALRQDGASAPGRTPADPGARDHRAPQHAVTEPPPPPRADPPAGRKINIQVTSDLSQVLRPALQECAANLAPGAAGATSRIEGEIVVSIKDHQATVTAANFQLRDIAEAAQADVQQCLVQRAVGVTASAGDEQDVDSYPITVSLRWP
ncbi:MAG TPA: hypothetical protein VHW23_38475 [Kofleriaceae bacterium]|jgi:hypothetical protein|nr:hypothetical protein [Kofleriaceae bacterium]